ncbi:MAG: sulfite exporter TauE/SafE family protein [Bacteroidota bacterium]|nr:sulfite exporter TauE/SafE family protein [Bacteroidota bacterium]
MLELWLAFLAGTLSSLHCIGMCGPIIMGCVAPRPIQISVSGNSAAFGSKAVAITPHLLYNSGRVLSYSMIGMIAGLVGSAALLSTALQMGFSIALGSMMIVMALFQLNIYPKLFRKERKDSFTKKFFSTIQSSKASEAKFLIGFLTPLLPCGLLYGMAAHAATSSSPVTGALEMGAFAFGSVPALMVTGLLSGAIGVRIRKYGTIFAAVLLVVMGLLTIARGAGIYRGATLLPFEQHVCGDTH